MIAQGHDARVAIPDLGLLHAAIESRSALRAEAILAGNAS